MKTKQLVNHIRQSPKSSGACATFVRINENWGVKFYTWKSDRDKCYQTQKKYAEHDVCPPVGGKIDLPESERKRYGFVTATTDGSIYDMAAVEFSELGGHNQWACYQDIPYDVIEEYWDFSDGLALEFDAEREDLLDRYEAMTGHRNIYDFHKGNWGIGADGRAYLIDVDHE